MSAFNFEPLALPAELAKLRREVREFLAAEASHYSPGQRARSWMGYDREFSRKLGARGWIGMTWPKQYGGHERTMLERYVVVEELLASGAPVGAHWIADRQSGTLLLRYGTEEQRQHWLPRIARGEVTFCIGMSEPDTGSDLASLRSRATKTDNGWRLNGTKIWTTFAHHGDAMIALVRTSGEHGDRHKGLSQVLIDLKAPGVNIRPIVDMTGDKHFNQIVFDDVLLPPDAVIGAEGQGWKQVTAELSLERSGPERYLSSYVAIQELVKRAAATRDDGLVEPIGRIVAELWTLREMSTSVAGQLNAGRDPMVEASVVKDLGNAWEQEVPRLVQALVDADLRRDAEDTLSQALEVLLQLSPSFSLRGGTKEVLRGIIARGLGLR
jgi:alkylation response protein AidB-like acyl-CoA dehydrogenase